MAARTRKIPFLATKKQREASHKASWGEIKKVTIKSLDELKNAWKKSKVNKKVS